MTSIYTINYALRAHKRDPFIEFIKGMLMTPFVLHSKPAEEKDIQSLRNDDLVEAETHIDANVARYCDILKSIEELIEECIQKQKRGLLDQSRLKRLVPSISMFHTPLPLCDSFLLANAKHSIAARRFVPPSFNDIRRILNTAQIIAIAPKLRLITFDGDMTLYGDGKDFEHNSALVNLLVQLLKFNLHVCVVTAAGYPGEAHRYEKRLSGLLKGFANAELPKNVCERFFVLESILSWNDEQIQAILNVAQKSLQRCIDDMKLPCTILRKSKAVGIVPKPDVKIFREQLDECVLSTQHRLTTYLATPPGKEHPIPYCAFNVLQEFFNTKKAETLHIGDQFLSTGNDYATRNQCCTLWIVNPEETQTVLVELVALLEAKRSERYTIEN
ncbi:13844_t:CDS:10 [Entrophospora sp. SA101]|nr:13250_t:CDS:10 [Entrophospora sp. SA101]CAJ0746903.1 13844_t:CDS:10 [Entrophospora sp. SA101]